MMATGTGMVGTEYELKSALTAELLSQVTSVYQFDAGVRVVDEYYADPNNILYEYGVFVRVRDGRRLDIKYNPDRTDDSHTQCVESSYPIPLKRLDSQEIDAFLRRFVPDLSLVGEDGLMASEPFLIVAKTRHSCTVSGVTICLDNVDHLGWFIEVEATGGGEGLRSVVEWAQRHGLNNVPVGYVELLLRERDPELYRRGRYQLPYDRV